MARVTLNCAAFNERPGIGPDLGLPRFRIRGCSALPFQFFHAAVEMLFWSHSFALHQAPAFTDARFALAGRPRFFFG